jgi:hypothetical protein
VIIGLEGQQWEKTAELAKLIVGDNGAYSLLSSSAHSEFWSLLAGYRGRAPSPLGRPSPANPTERNTAQRRHNAPSLWTALAGLCHPVSTQQN